MVIGAMCGPFLDQFPEGFRINRFGEMVIHACGQATFLFTCHGVGRDGDDGDQSLLRILILLQGSYFLSAFNAVHLRHLNVHHDQIKGVGQNAIEGLFAIGSQENLTAHFLQHGLNHLLVDGVIIGNQDRERIPLRGFWLN